VDAEEFRAFQEWRASVQESETEDERGRGRYVLGPQAPPIGVGSKGCGPPAVGPRARAGGIGVKRGFDDGQRGGLGDGPSAGFPMAPAKRRAPAEASQEMKGQVGTREGPAGRLGANGRPPGGFCMRRGTGDLAVQARGESSGSVFVKTHGQTGQQHYQPGAGACDARLGWDGQIRLGSGIREEGKDAFNGVVEVDVGVLLELASRAGVQLEDVEAMTRAQLTLGSAYRHFANDWLSLKGGGPRCAPHHGDGCPGPGHGGALSTTVSKWQKGGVMGHDMGGGDASGPWSARACSSGNAKR
jgi:hypothetical protein